MKKKYSDPLMFSALMLADSIPLRPSQNGESPDPDEEYVERPKGIGVNDAPKEQIADPVTIVNPVEEAVNSSDTFVEEPSSAASTTAPQQMEVTPVIDTIVPDDTASSGASE